MNLCRYSYFIHILYTSSTRTQYTSHYKQQTDRLSIQKIATYTSNQRYSQERIPYIKKDIRKDRMVAMSMYGVLVEHFGHSYICFKSNKNNHVNINMILFMTSMKNANMGVASTVHRRAIQR